MVLFLIGIGVTLFVIREIIRLWYASDNVLWIAPLKPPAEATTGPEPEAQLLSDIHAPRDEDHKDDTQKPKCPHGQELKTSMTDSAACCDQAKPSRLVESSYEFQTAKIVSTLPKEVRDMLLEEAYKLEKKRRKSNSLADYISKLDTIKPPPPPVTEMPPETTPPSPVAPMIAEGEPDVPPPPIPIEPPEDQQPPNTMPHDPPR